MAGHPEVTQTLAVHGAGDGRLELHGWTLEVVAGPDKGRSVRTLGALLRVGTDAGNDLVLTDPTVSRRHLEVERTADGLVAKDLGSRNGSFVEGRRILQAHVAPGETLTVGSSRLALKREAQATSVETLGGERFGELVGGSEPMRVLFAELRRVARDDGNVLLEGETGTGKELAARAVHGHSARRHGAFRVVDCTLLAESNVDAELFGRAGHPGAFEASAGGTVYLDEVGELRPELQPRLLRVLETREIPRPDGSGAQPVDVRILASTARNLEEEVRQGRFRADLYFRLAQTRVRLPALRTHRQDLELLSRHLAGRLGRPLELSPQTLALFEQYDWPGNVRELRNVVERAALVEQTGSTGWLDFLGAAPAKGASRGKSLGAVLSELKYHEARDRVLADFEQVYFAEVMKAAGFDIQVAEEKTGLSMQSLYRLLKKNGLRLKDLKNADGL
jgi:two-component system response regulator GlrR